MLRATTACTFSTSQLPKVVRPWCILHVLTWKYAPRHNGLQPNPPHTRAVPFFAACTHFTQKTQVFFSPASSPKQSPCIFFRSVQCGVQPQFQDMHRITHTGTTVVATHIEGTKRPQPHPPHTRDTFHRRLQPLYTENTRVFCSGFLPKKGHMQHVCSHSNASCNYSSKKRTELRTQEQPLLQKNIEGPKRPQPHLLHTHTQGTFHDRLQPLYTENTRFRSPDSSQNKAHPAFMQSFQYDLPPHLQIA